MNPPQAPVPADGLRKAQRALRAVAVSLPHLAGLAAAARVAIDPRVATMSVFASGRILINPDFLAKLTPHDALFVLAHELLHLALRTHDRQQGSDPLLINYAHDYIINDMLVHDLNQAIPAGGLALQDARFRSMENIAADLRGRKFEGPPTGWLPPRMPPPAPEPRKSPPSGLGNQLRDALKKAGLPPPPELDEPPAPQPPPPTPAGDVLGNDQERQWFPETDLAQIQKQARHIEELAARADSLAAVIDRMKNLAAPQPGGFGPIQEAYVTAVRGVYASPWQSALQRWLDAVAPGRLAVDATTRGGR